MPLAQLFPDICDWKPKSKFITVEKFSVFCLVLPGLMSVEISPLEIQELFEAAIKAWNDRNRKKATDAASEEQKKKEEGLTAEEVEAMRKLARKEKPGKGPPAKKVMDAEVFSDFALPMVRRELKLMQCSATAVCCITGLGLSLHLRVACPNLNASPCLRGPCSLHTASGVAVPDADDEARHSRAADGASD